MVDRPSGPGITPRLRPALRALELEGLELAQDPSHVHAVALPTHRSEAARDRHARPSQRSRERPRLELDDELGAQLRKLLAHHLELPRVVDARDHRVSALTQAPKRLERADVGHAAEDTVCAMAPEAKRFDYAAAVDRAGRISAESGPAVGLGQEWTPDHLLLVALARCSIESMRYHAARSGGDLVASAETSGVVTRREDDDRYAFVEIECAVEVELEPEPSAEELRALVAKAERDCFVGASLTVKPAYRWRVNGTDV